MEVVEESKNNRGFLGMIVGLLIILAVIFLGPIGLLLLVLFRKDWWQSSKVKLVSVAWSALYLFAGMSDSSPENKPIEVGVVQNQTTKTETQSETVVLPFWLNSEEEDITDKSKTTDDTLREEATEAESTKASPQQSENDNTPKSPTQTPAKTQSQSQQTSPKPQSQQNTPAKPAATPKPVTSKPTSQPQPDAKPVQTQKPANNSVSVPSNINSIPTTDCKIKGNVNSKGEKIYHTPASQYYSKTKVKPEEGDRWFCTEAEAQAAGFRAPLR